MIFQLFSVKKQLRLRSGIRNRDSMELRLGAATVEFATVAPLMIMLTMGMMEVGRMVMVKQLMVSASREGARLGTLPGVGQTEVVARVYEELTAVGVAGVAITVSPANLGAVPAGTPVTVSLSVPANQVSWINTPLFSMNTTLEASTTMRRESQ